MKKENLQIVKEAKEAAIKVLLHNLHGPFDDLPRTAGWGYPEPYTRDLMICTLGILSSGNEELIASVRKILETLAKNQTKLGDIPSLVHNPGDLGSSDVTPLFLMGAALYRKVSGEKNFLKEAVHKSLIWMDYQSPGDDMMVIQMPTTDWRDEQFVWGYGLYVNTLVYIYNKLFENNEKAKKLKIQFNQSVIAEGSPDKVDKEGFILENKAHYAFWCFKIYKSDRFDLLGNSLAIITGLASKKKQLEIIQWVNMQKDIMKENGDLVVDLPPNFFPFIREEDVEWRPRYKDFNLPGEYHNGGIWPFISAFYIVALVSSGHKAEAEKQLVELTRIVRLSKNPTLDFGFNEWIKAQDGKPKGQDWQSWSAAMYLYAANCVEKDNTIFFENFED